MSNKQSRSTYANVSILGIVLLTVSITAAFADEQAAPDQAAQEQQASQELGSFIVKDGKVDPNTYQGYLTYTRHCQACHGPDALGSSFAPSLVKAAGRRSFAEIARTIAGGLQIQPGRVMPSFAEDPTVISNIPNVYSYLMARNSEELGRGRPKIIEEMQPEKQD